MHLPKGILIAIEGIDGAGKTAQVDLLCEHFERADIDYTRSKEPTNGVHGRKLRASAASGRLDPEDELATFIRDRKEHVARVITPALELGHIVVIDRYYLSTAAYQSIRGFDPAAIITVNEQFAPVPDSFILLEISAAVALERIAARGQVGRNEFEQAGALRRCAEVFAAIQHANMLRIDGTLPREEIHHRILRAIDEGPLFRAACFKPYLEACEPELCSYRLTSQCHYPEMDMQRPPSKVSWAEVDAIAKSDMQPEEKIEALRRLLAAER